MGFQMRMEDGRHCPIVTCDACGTVIKDHNWGGVVYRWTAEGETVSIRVLFKVNQRLANDPAEAWQELGHYLVYLLQNTGIKTEKDYRRERAEADMLGRL